MPNALSDLLDETRRARRWTLRDMANHLHVSAGYLSRVISGQRVLPLERLDEWLDALDIHGEPRETWVAAVTLEYAPAAVRDRYQAQARELARLRARLAELEGG